MRGCLGAGQSAQHRSRLGGVAACAKGTFQIAHSGGLYVQNDHLYVQFGTGEFKR